MDSILEPKQTLELKLDLSLIPGSVLGPVPLISDLKSSNSSNHIPLLDIGIDHNDSVIIFQDCSYNRDDYNVRVSHDPIQFGDNKTVNKKDIIKCGFFENPRYLDWAATLGLIRPPQEPQP